MPSCFFLPAQVLVLFFYFLESFHPEWGSSSFYFVHFCETFLGILPCITLFCYFFCLKPQPKTASPYVLGGCGIQFRQGRQKEYFEYTLVDFVKEWRTEWFYAGNMLPSLAVHSNAGPIANDRWEKEHLMPEEINKIKPFLVKIKTPKM